MQNTICAASGSSGANCQSLRGVLGGDAAVHDWHRMITRIEVNKFGIASVWLKEKGLLLFVPTVKLGGYSVVNYTALVSKLSARGVWPDTLRRN